jgi:predicted small lipoprotein YifL
MAAQAEKRQNLISPLRLELGMMLSLLGAIFLNRFYDRTLLRLALVGALVASLGLAACGRKGPLDSPPGGSLAGDQATPIGGQSKDENPGVDANGRPQAPKGPNKRIPLDVLLN